MNPPSQPLSGEDRLIADYFVPVARHPGALALADDAAFLTPPDGSDLVLTTDAVVGGVHFFPDDPPDLIARKALRVNISDLAAKGATPAGFLLSLALPAGIPSDWLSGFSSGLAADAEHYACALFGGDTVRTTGPITIAITAFGTLPRGAMIHRAGAQVGDHVFVSGTIGDAALGLRLRSKKVDAQTWRLSPNDADRLIDRYLLPQPRAVLANAVRRYASAAMDVSDGLVGDLSKLCRASAVSARIEVRRVPLSDAAGTAIKEDLAAIEIALTGGDDYEILCTIGPENVLEFASAAAAAGVQVTEIGVVEAGGGKPRFVDTDGRIMSFAQNSFSHF